ncbi:hypothetical protein [Streptomyces syringium]|uniref:hypothetical protein n=1 Tax=Streptomyces syringium TaxID=76729 RepID=UPI0037D922D0
MPNQPHRNPSPFFAVSGGTLIAMARPGLGHAPARRPRRWLALLANRLDLKRG